MGTISYSIPVAGQPNATEDPKVATALQTILTGINGNLDAINLSALLAQSASVNQSGQTVKGATNIATSESTSSVTFTTLATPDQVTGIMLPTNGLIRVWYQALWQESVVASGRAAIFVGSQQLRAQGYDGVNHAPLTQGAATGNNTPAVNLPLATFGGGLASFGANTATPFSADVTTGQVAGGGFAAATVSAGGTATTETGSIGKGGPCDIFAAAGTYTISVQFRAALGGSVTAVNRKLWVQALSFA